MLHFCLWFVIILSKIKSKRSRELKLTTIGVTQKNKQRFKKARRSGSFTANDDEFVSVLLDLFESQMKPESPLLQTKDATKKEDA